MKGLRIVYGLIFITFSTAAAYAQQPLPHGMIYGNKPDTSGAMDAVKLKQFMGSKKRISTKIKGKVAKVTAEKGGWFEIEAGKHTISAHFKDYNVVLPAEIKGRIVIVDAVAARNFSADDGQHFAGDTVTYKTDTQLRQRISLEVKGLMVYQ